MTYDNAPMIDIVHLDLETASSVPLPKTGVYPYAEQAKILMAAWAINDGPITLWDCTDGSPMPEELRALLTDPNVIKVAHNAQFERTLIKACWGIDCPPEQWRCTQVLCYANGLPGALGEAAYVLGLREQKDPIGAKLIKTFSIPQKPTKRQPKEWLTKEDRPEEWEQFKSYCVKDVAVERAIHHCLRDLSRKEWELWALDQRANDRGLMVNQKLMVRAMQIDSKIANELLEEAVRLTGLDNPNSVAQLKQWLIDTAGCEVDSLNKATIAELNKKMSGNAKRVLQIRAQLGKTSINKYQAMDRSMCIDGRVRGLLQFYGASRTGRWAGRLIQVQNLPRPSIEEFAHLDAAREAVMLGDVGLLKMIYGNVPSVLSDLIRTAFVAAPGHRFIVCDESAIEARVLAWLAQEEWRLEVFATHGKIYEASASQMFKVPLDRIKKGNPEYALRQKGKVAELALGYQGASGALMTMGAIKMGLTEEELPGLVAAWRKANPRVVKLWQVIEDDAKRVIRDRVSIERKRWSMGYDDGALLLYLPSGRPLVYRNAKIDGGKIKFDGTDQTTKKWGRIDTYGGKLVENLTQAVARDCMAEAMLRIRDAGYQICMTVHDEVVCEVPDGFGSVEEVERLMGEEIEWAPGLPLKGAGFESAYYRKD